VVLSALDVLDTFTAVICYRDKSVPSHLRFTSIVFIRNVIKLICTHCTATEQICHCVLPIRKHTHVCVKFVTELLVGLDNEEVRLLANPERPMYSRMQFAALELMCRERAALAKKEMEYSLAEYWLAEAEEWREFADLSYPFIENASPIAPVS
jgi:hypothetical protein